MSLVALSYPRVPEEHQKFMDEVRNRHDRKYKDIVRPHFSLVFSVPDIPETAFLAHVAAIAAKHEPIPFVCRYAMTHDDRANDDWYVFLVPDEGFSAIARLHDELYTGILAPHLLLDRPYIPHIGVATNRDNLACKRLADELNSGALLVSGAIDAITISEYDGTAVRDLRQVPLGRGQQHD
jgi:2'-5' RNA ligase